MKLFEFTPIKNKFPTGTSKPNDKVIYELKIAKCVNPKEVYFVCFKEGEDILYEPMQLSSVDSLYFYYAYSKKFTSVGHYWYAFKINTEEETFYLQKGNLFECEKTNNLDNYYLQLIHYPIMQADNELKKGVIYQIFVDSFCKVGKVKAREGFNLREDWGGEFHITTNQEDTQHIECFGGNFKGIISKLDYLKNLNVSTIYLSPICEAQSNHKYNTANYEKIDSMYGTKDDFKELIAKAHDLNIHIILDGVFNHTGSDSVYFNKLGRYSTLGAFQSKESPYFDWYTFKNYPLEYDSWWGIKTLPETNESSKAFVKYITDTVIEKYMDMGIAGYRLDVVDELGDTFVQEIAKAIKKEYPKPLLVGEVWEDASLKISYGKRRKYFLGEELNSVTNYMVKNAIIDYVKNKNLNSLLNALYTILDQYPAEVQNNLMNILDTHDTERILTILGKKNRNEILGNIKLTNAEKENAIELLKIASLLQYTLMGIPTLFYGDEAGVEGGLDPYCRACFPWGKEDKTLLDWYTKLGGLRKNSLFIDGTLEIKYAQDNILVFERIKKNKKIIVAINLGGETFNIELNTPMKNYFTNTTFKNLVSIEPNQFVVLV